jgi:hypothetical protein
MAPWPDFNPAERPIRRQSRVADQFSLSTSNHQSAILRGMTLRTDDDLDTRLPYIRSAPADRGSVELIVRRPGVDERETVTEAVLDPDVGLVGDGWLARGSRSTADGSADPACQVTLISVRVLEAIEPDRSRWPLAGDQVYVDLDLSVDGLPAGTRLAIGTAVIEVSEPPHTGCAKFSARFGTDALKFVNKSPGRELRLRGVNTRIVTPGAVRAGDTISKL